ncbi:MAG TPA: lyase [Xanthobacteraceae bacterium]|nr:lyase [Xanthobacteraceae bacterium]
MIRSAILAIAASAMSLSVAGAASVNFYQLPSNAYPHDVAPAADGAVWYSGQRLGVLGRFDPKTGKAEHIPLGPNSAPHGVIVGPDGAPWLTDGGHNAIVRVDPKTYVVRLFPLPKEFPGANLNTAVFDKRGILWFTGQGGVYGRVNPMIGKVEAWQAPKGYGPYGITVTPAGQIWYASLASDFIAQIDPATGASAVVEPPKRGAGPRRIWSDSKGILWVSLWNAGGLGRYDPAAKSWSVYPMPVSRTGTYAVYVDDKDRVWATDWQANAIQRFDTKTEKFDTFPSDKPRANVRQLLGRPGEIWGGESGTDRLVVVRD